MFIIFSYSNLTPGSGHGQAPGFEGTFSKKCLIVHILTQFPLRGKQSEKLSSLFLAVNTVKAVSANHNTEQSQPITTQRSLSENKYVF